MDAHFSDAELLDLTVLFSDDDITATETHSKRKNPQQKIQEEKHKDKITTSPEARQKQVQKHAPSRQRDRQHHHTLKKINHKLNIVHDQLSGIKRNYQLDKPSYKASIPSRYANTINTGKTYRLTTMPTKILFKISNPFYIQWQSMAQNIIIRAPHRYEKTTSWPNQEKRAYQPTHSSDYAKYVIIQGLHIMEMTQAHFHFRPTQAYQDILIEERIYYDKAIKLRLTKAASRKPLLIPKGSYLGNLFVVFPMSVQVC